MTRATGTGADDVLLLEAIDAMISPRDAVLRFLPHRDRRLVGAWCFVDVYGPWDLRGQVGMTVAPHAHIGLQTVSWLLEGRVLHRDSLGTTATVEPGHAAVMTAGRGIAHSENSPPEHPDGLHGAQLWIALPEADRNVAPAFELTPSVAVPLDGGTAKVFVGSLADVGAPTRGYTPLLGAEVSPDPGEGRLVIPLDPAYEHLVLPMIGTARLDGAELTPRRAGYVGPGRTQLHLDVTPDARMLLLGGEPFGEAIVMWWNFVARTHEQIAEAQEQWNGGSSRFGEVAHYPDGTRLAAPPLPNVRLSPRGATR